MLEDAIHEINNHNASGLSFEELYRYIAHTSLPPSLFVQSQASAIRAFCRNAYNMVINKFGDQLYNGLEETIVKHLQLIEKKVEAAQGESFLRELKLRWDHHNKSMQMIRDILMVIHAGSFSSVWTVTRLLLLRFACLSAHDCSFLLAVHGPHICQAPKQGACTSAWA